MANVDTGLGWSIEQQYLTDNPIKLGDMTSLKPLTIYMEGGMIPTGNPIPSEVYARGLQIYINNAFPERSRYVLAEAGASVVAVNCTNDPPSASNPLDVYLISDKQGAAVYSLIYNSDDQSLGNMTTYTCDTASSGFYYRRLTPSQAAGYDTTMIPHYTTLTDALADLSKSTQPVYKYAAGPAGGAWARWIDLGGNIVTAPTLISSVANNTPLSLDGETPASTSTSAGMLYKGMSFTLTLIPGHSGGITNTAVPFLDITAAFPRPIGLATLFEALLIAENVQVTEPGDPYGGPTSESGGGDGEPDTGEDVPFSTPPNISAVGSGFLTLFTPSLATIQQVAGWMWSSGFDVDTVKKIFLNPIDAVLGLHIVPCATFPDGNKEIKIAGVGSGYSSDYTTHQYMPVDCGSVDIPKKWGSYLDYSPYTRTQIFLPYIGFREIDIDDIQGKTVQLRYLIDILSGSCNAELRVPTDDGHNAILYSWAGQCAAQIPITSGDLRGAISGAVSIAASVGAALATGGATAAIGAGATVAYNMFSQKTHIQRSGSVSGAGGFIAGQQAYIVRSQPNIALPAEQNKFSGYPSFVTISLGNTSGYTEIESIHMENVPATDSELDEIETLLKGGVIL